jgi:hypothetical protein
MNESGCKNCPVAPCDAQYRGSRCAALRSKHNLGDPKTNADRIRAMSNEELASWITKLFKESIAGSKVDCELDEAFENDLLDFFNLPSEGAFK